MAGYRAKLAAAFGAGTLGYYMAKVAHDALTYNTSFSDIAVNSFNRSIAYLPEAALVVGAMIAGGVGLVEFAKKKRE